MKKLILSCAVGFVVAALLYSGDVAARQVAVSLVLFGAIALSVLLAGVMVAAFLLATCPGYAFGIFEPLSQLARRFKSAVPRARVSRVDVAEVTQHANWSDNHIDYENYEIPSYLRRGYDREAL
jgi:hypothetical protein